jgi:septal ring factor EnvC (AmiA/AmiB activator)
LAGIYHAITGEHAVGELRPMNPHERAVSLRAYHAILKKERMDRTLRQLRREIVAVERERDTHSVALGNKERELNDVKARLEQRERDVHELEARLRRYEAESSKSADRTCAPSRSQATVRSALRVAKELAQAVRRGDR